MKIKKSLVIGLLIMMLMPLRANAFSWGDFFRALFGLGTTETTAADMVTITKDANATLTDLEKQSVTLDKETQTAFISLVSTISSKDDAATIKSNLEKANALTDTAKRNTAVNKVYSDYATTLNNNKVELLVIFRLLTESEKATLTSAIKTLSTKAESYSNLAKKCNETYKNVTNKTSYTDDRESILKKISEYSAVYTTKATVIGTLATEAKIFAKLGGIKI